MALAPHARVQLEGKLLSGLGGPEIWSCSIAIYSPAGGGGFISDPQGYCNRTTPHIADWFGSVAGGIATNASLEVVKVNNINAAGHYQDASTHETVISGGLAGVASPHAPAFCSIATTWETGLARGYAHRGRNYFPNYVYIANGSYIGSADVNAVAASGKAFLSALVQELDGAGTVVAPCVVSKHAGERNAIGGVSVDNIYDYISRRKNRLVSVRNRVDWP